jgi:hypothetical protein
MATSFDLSTPSLPLTGRQIEFSARARADSQSAPFIRAGKQGLIVQVLGTVHVQCQ